MGEGGEKDPTEEDDEPFTITFEDEELQDEEQGGKGVSSRSKNVALHSSHQLKNYSIEDGKKKIGEISKETNPVPPPRKKLSQRTQNWRWGLLLKDPQRTWKIGGISFVSELGQRGPSSFMQNKL